MPGKKRKKPAYPKVGTGEDFPARRPGVKTGETRSGAKVMQSTRATAVRSMKAAKRGPAPMYKAPLHQTRRLTVGRTETWRGGRPTGRPRPNSGAFSAGVRGKPTRRNPWPL